MLSSEGMQRRKTEKNKNSPKFSKSNFARAAHFLIYVHFFPVVLHDYNVKLPETS